MDNVWVLYLIIGAIPGLIIFAALYKFYQVWLAARWPSTPGKVVVSTTEARVVDTGGPNSTETETRTFAKIEYVYSVAGREYRGHRVSIGEDLGNFEVKETLARYPIGKPVTVYYNPMKCEQAVLERDIPAGTGKGLAIVLGFFVAVGVVGTVGYYGLGEVARLLVVDPERVPFVTACTLFALVAALFCVAFQKNAARARTWPKVKGRVETSGVQAYQERNTDDKRWRTMYRADVSYSYQVGGVRYVGDKMSLGGKFSSSIEALAKRTAARLKRGATVDVFYNPQNPTEAVLQPRAGKLWLMWLIPAAVFALAFVVARYG